MAAEIESTQEAQSSRNPLGRLLWVSPVAIAVTTVANLGLYLTAGTIIPEVAVWPGAGIGQIVGANIAYLFVGTLVFALVARFSSRPARHYWMIATAGLLLSLGLPIAAGFGYAAPGAPPASLATVVTLSLMHIVAYAISVPLFIRQIVT